MFHGSEAYFIKTIFQQDSRAAVFRFYVEVGLSPVSLKTHKEKVVVAVMLIQLSGKQNYYVIVS